MNRLLPHVWRVTLPKTMQILWLQALVLEGRLLGADQLKAVASMPSRDEALAQLMMVMKGPVVKLARTLAETYAQLVRAVSAVPTKNV